MQGFRTLALIIWAANTTDGQVFKTKQASQELRAKVSAVVPALHRPEAATVAKSLTTWASSSLPGNAEIVITGQFTAQRRRKDGMRSLQDPCALRTQWGPQEPPAPGPSLPKRPGDHPGRQVHFQDHAVPCGHVL